MLQANRPLALSSPAYPGFHRTVATQSRHQSVGTYLSVDLGLIHEVLVDPHMRSHEERRNTEY